MGRSAPGLHLLAQNEDLDPAQYPSIRALIEELRGLHDGAARYIAAQGLDPEVFLPGNIWADLTARTAFREWTYDLVNYSRAISPFSGFHMMLWGREDLRGDLDRVQAKCFYDDLFSGALRGAAIADRMEAMRIPERMERSRRNRLRFYRARENLAPRYDRLVAKTPARFHIDAPKRGGEIGLLHRQRILNPDLLAYQGRINALYGAGVLAAIDRIIERRGSANYLEIGPGHGFFACALQSMFAGRLNVFLIDLPLAIANGLAYVSCVAGVDSVGLATPQAWPSPRPFVFVPNYVVPSCRARLPRFDLVHNALSLNEMSARQVAYYLDLVDEHLADDGVFHLSRGGKYLRDHQDALGMAIGRLRLRKLYRRSVEGIPVSEAPNSFFESSRVRG